VASLWLLLLLCLSVVVVVVEAKKYQVTAQRSFNVPIISSQNHGQSTFLFNYNTAYVPMYDTSKQLSHALLVRCQNQTAGTLGPSMFSFTAQTGHGKYQPITDNNIVFRPTTPEESYGTEDPRVAYQQSTGTYYMFYTAVETASPDLIVRLSLATTKTPSVASSWKRQGAIFPDVNKGQWTKSGALLIRDTGPSYLIFGDSAKVPGLQVASTQDLQHYTLLDGIYLPVRNNSFDSTLVEAGPPPLLLSDGNYLFIYNSARANSTSPNHLQYNIGWLIINGTNPLHIIERCERPLLSPQLGWEVGAPPYLSLVPNVVFCEGMHASSDPDTFVIYYGAADSVIGQATVSVQIQ